MCMAEHSTTSVTAHFPQQRLPDSVQSIHLRLRMSNFNPDSWVAETRDSRLIPRTGIIPWNAETPPESLLDYDITPASLHYVRNHAAVPKLDWASHRLELFADSQSEAIFLTMDELKNNYEPCEMLVTFACDGNRRQELNELEPQRSNGFDWGPCAVSTASWKGALLRDVIENLFDSLEGYQFVLFEGADELKHGPYGTSIPIAHVMNSTTDVLLAYEMNGEPIPPDHGYPVRTIVPGFVGGRTVKWLKKITLSAHESSNWSHLHDNRVFPPHVQNTGMIGSWKHSPSTLIYQMNLNSFVLKPAHGEVLSVLQDLQAPYTLHGCAYDGAGRLIIRVEVSIDSGKSWRVCDHHYPAGSRPRYGYRYWAMCKWEVSIPLWEIVSCREIVVRAWDGSYNTQPERHTWNLLGMMNNAWYRLQVRRDCPGSVTILHPVRTDKRANQPDGHMEQAKVIYPEHIPTRNYSWEEVTRHTSVDDCWVVVDGKVYDLSDFLNSHPGGSAAILAHAGRDVTAEFLDIHSADANILKANYVIGYVGKEIVTPHVSARIKQPNETPDGHPVVLNPHEWITVTLSNKQELTHDTRRFTFKLASPDHRMWLPWGKHIDMAMMISPSRMVVRPYTPIKPILPEEDNGTFELVVKIYFPTNRAPGGLLTTRLEQLKIGDTVKVKGPEGTTFYSHDGIFEVMGHFIHCTKVNFIVGGTGLTPALAVIRGMLLAEDPARKKIVFISSNKTVDDILCNEELTEFETRFPEQFHLWHMISQMPSTQKDWKYGTGYITEQTLRDHCHPPSPGTACFVCGPPGFIAQAVMPNLAKLGFDEEHIFEF